MLKKGCRNAIKVGIYLKGKKIQIHGKFLLIFITYK